MPRYYKRKVNKNLKLKKRWYLNAGANLPFIGKTTITAGSGNRLGKRNFTGAVKAIVRNDLEHPQHHVIADNALLFLPVTNALYPHIWNPLSGIPVGGNRNERSGDVIRLERLKLKLNVQQDSSISDQTTHRFMVFKDNSVITTSNFPGTHGSFSLTGMNLGNANGTTGSFVTTAGLIDPKKITVVYDETFKVSPQVAGTFHTLNKDISIPFNSKFIYDSGSVVGKNGNYYCAYWSSRPNTSTTFGNVSINQDLIFKNSL